MGDAGDDDIKRGRAIAPAAAKQDLTGIGAPLAPPMFAALLSRIFNWSRSGVGPRLLAAVLLFSSVVTLTLTALQLYLDYNREVGLIETRLDEIGRSTTGSLERACGISTRTSSSSSSMAFCGCLTSVRRRSARSPIGPIRSVSRSASETPVRS